MAREFSKESANKIILALGSTLFISPEVIDFRKHLSEFVAENKGFGVYPSHDTSVEKWAQNTAGDWSKTITKQGYHYTLMVEVEDGCFKDLDVFDSPSSTEEEANIISGLPYEISDIIVSEVKQLAKQSGISLGNDWKYFCRHNDLEPCSL